MAVTKYTYSISADTVNGIVASDRLTEEIGTSSIVTGLDHIDTVDDTLDIWMKEAISAGDKTTLDGIVAAHDGTLLSVPELIDLNNNLVEIEEEPTAKTGGHFQAGTLECNVSDTLNAWEVTDFTWPIPMGVLSAQWLAKAVNDKDILEVQIGPDTTVGTITQDVTATDTKIYVSQSVLDNIKVGYWCTLTDGTNTDDCGRVIAVNSDNIDVETAAVNGFAAATPTYVKQTVKMVPGCHLCDGMQYEIGTSKIGASYVPAGTVIRVRYQNNEGSTGKKFYIEYDALY